MILKIASIESIPRFIGLYFNEHQISMHEISQFDKLLNELYFTCIDTDEYITSTNHNNFITFYLEKTRLDRYLNCKYEDELDIPKSISNELFVARTNNGDLIQFIIEDYYLVKDMGILKIKIIRD